jgi:translation initiation factor 3 subunit K
LSDLLERCQFREFWALLRQDKANYADVVSHVKGFDEGIYEFILHIVSKTFQTIEYGELKEILGDLSNDEMNKLIKSKGWKKLEDNYVFVANHEDIVKTKNIVEKIKFDDVSPVMNASIKSQIIS